MALEEARRLGEVEVVGLLTTITRPYDRVSMHGVRRVLIDRQAEALGLPVLRVEIPARCSNRRYEEAMGRAIRTLERRGVERMIFGDLFLEDVRAYREARLADSGIRPIFPLWGRPTDRLAREMIARGLEARLVCLDRRRLPEALAGRPFDDRLLGELPADVDPCGERGEFHTYVTYAPGFGRRIEVRAGRVVRRGPFVFADLRPARRAPTRGGRSPGSRRSP